MILNVLSTKFVKLFRDQTVLYIVHFWQHIQMPNYPWGQFMSIHNDHNIAEDNKSQMSKVRFLIISGNDFVTRKLDLQKITEICFENWRQNIV